MDARPPLHIHLLAHPQSVAANALASALMRRFVEPPASGGLRVPVFFTRDRGDDLPPDLEKSELNLDAAQHTILVILADERMLRVVPKGTGREWRDFAKHAVSLAALDSSPHHVLPIALEPEGFSILDGVHVLPALLTDGHTAERRTAEVSFHIAARSIQLIRHHKVPAQAPEKMKAPVTIFFSHAKADFQKNTLDPVHCTREALKYLPVEQWFDENVIATSQRFAKAIAAGVHDSTILLAFQTDQYSSRFWCREEVLEAKRSGVHILVVDALESGEPRSFPYGGNVPVVHWRGNDPEGDARRVIDRAVLEALRFTHNRPLLQPLATQNEVVLAAAPESLTLAYASDQNVAAETTFLYPDLPLGREELDVLRRLRPSAKFTTPLTKIAALPRDARMETICVSISPSHDLTRFGLSAEHFRTLTDEIHLYLLVAGLRIAYGGALKGDFSDNVTLRLFDLVRAYSKLSAGAEAKPLHDAILNVAPWPLRLSYGDAEWKLFAGEVAGYEESPRPDLPWSDDEVLRFEPGAAEHRYSWARGLTAMRECITRQSQARIAIGGNLQKFSGLVPGIVEEVWFSVHSGQPLFLVGGFGGAARAVCDILAGHPREELTESWLSRKLSNYDSAKAYYEAHGTTFHSVEQLCADMKERASSGLAKALNNGLDESENQELMQCTDAQRIARLVLLGLERL